MVIFFWYVGGRVVEVFLTLEALVAKLVAKLRSAMIPVVNTAVIPRS
jgi:hypothetical protein